MFLVNVAFLSTLSNFEDIPCAARNTISFYLVDGGPPIQNKSLDEYYRKNNLSMLFSKTIETLEDEEKSFVTTHVYGLSVSHLHFDDQTVSVRTDFTLRLRCKSHIENEQTFY